ncbi:hypothetical protein NUW54_g11764 [Trametes sanguinea]|uniref:Uncharacterized protein n=1 Tax=Trametes sanguinea TaxID=158606 RepID=A0ACC1N840_9APHY|nr:hypothetical protein NUW54_g11764 [Trametes sanguinea]
MRSSSVFMYSATKQSSSSSSISISQNKLPWPTFSPDAAPPHSVVVHRHARLPTSRPPALQAHTLGGQAISSSEKSELQQNTHMKQIKLDHRKHHLQHSLESFWSRTPDRLILELCCDIGDFAPVKLGRDVSPQALSQCAGDLLDQWEHQRCPDEASFGAEDALQRNKPRDDMAGRWT